MAVDLARLLDVVEVDFPVALEGDRRIARARAAAVDDDVLDESEVAHRFVDRRLEGDLLAAPEGVVAGDDDLGARVDDARSQGLGAHAGEDDRMDGADARAGEHGDDALGHERHVDDHRVALPHPEALQGVGEAVHLAIEAVVGVSDLFAVLAHPEQGGFVAAVGMDVAVDAVDRGVQLPAEEPLVVRRLEAPDGVERLDPVDELGALRPEDLRILRGGGALDVVVDQVRPARELERRLDHLFVVSQAGDRRALGFTQLEIGCGFGGRSHAHRQILALRNGGNVAPLGRENPAKTGSSGRNRRPQTPK